MTETAVAGTPTRWELTGWRSEFGVVAGITGRGGGFDLGFRSPEPTADVLARWEALQQALGPGFPGIVVGRQVHGSHVRTWPNTVSGWVVIDGVDGHLTRQPGVLLTVTVADCIPVFLAHPRSGSLALLHAGWRGVAAGILEVGIRGLIATCKCASDELIMHCGIGICGDCYEVGPEVRSAVLGGPEGDKGSLDLRAALLARGSAAGVARRSSSTWCAAHHPEHFFSHRRSRGTDGRMVAYLGRPVPSP